MNWADRNSLWKLEVVKASNKWRRAWLSGAWVSETGLINQFSCGVGQWHRGESHMDDGSVTLVNWLWQRWAGRHGWVSHWVLGAVWILVFPSPITLFSSLITQKWWDPRKERLFGFVFKFCFPHSIFWFLSNELAKRKTSFGCFWVMETKLWWHFCKYTHIEGPTIRALLRSSRNFWQTELIFLCFGMGLATTFDV